MAASLASGLIVAVAPAHAQQIAGQAYDLPAQPLGDSLRAVALASGANIIAPSTLIAGKTAPVLSGRFTPAEAVAILLSGSGLRARQTETGLIIERSDSGARDAQPGESESAIVVTGSRIRGAPIASPVISIGQEQMRNSGQSDLGQVVRSIPQNFGGGQNPGIGANVPSASGINVGSASTINLRGLGSDATLTLLNGHRLAYNGSRQGIDVSSIPIGMVDRVEIVADGASALYGSDAVAGVANIILKRDYEGLETRAEIGGSTDGGNFRQQYSAVAGTRWGAGGVIAGYEFARNTDILSDERSYAASRPGVTLYPALRRHAVALAGHQELTDRLGFSIDALYNKRWSRSAFPLNAAGDLDISRTEQNSTSGSLAIAPSLTLDLASDWRLSLSGMYGEEKVQLHSDSYAGGNEIGSAFVCYCNKGASVELAADGRLFELPGGPAKLAVGIGYRYNLLDAFRAEGDVNNVRRSQEAYYLYGEVNLPLISPGQDIPLANRLSLSGAVRYERYPGIDSVATPKLGLVYAPTPDLEFKATWGRSFRAPTLLQRYQVISALLYPAASLGGTGYPADAMALLIQGGNPELEPEHARTWTATVELHPRAVPGLRVQLGYFSTRYTDRIVTPISFQAQALSDPLYADRVTLAPGADAVLATIADAAQFFNVSGLPYEPTGVVAIVNNGNVNAGRQTIRGLDLFGDYRTRLGRNGGELSISLNASYLESEQQLTPGAPVLPKAGALFNPPHWRGRGSVTWIKGPFTLNASANYIGGVDDIRFTPSVRVASMTTFDLTARYDFTASRGLLRGLDLRLTVQNAFEDQPDPIATTRFSDTAYDSTNYSPIGRYAAVAIGKTW
jgi:outer membrane receptor protein involved in Fe transport